MGNSARRSLSGRMDYGGNVAVKGTGAEKKKSAAELLRERKIQGYLEQISDVKKQIMAADHAIGT